MAGTVLNDFRNTNLFIFYQRVVCKPDPQARQGGGEWVTAERVHVWGPSPASDPGASPAPWASAAFPSTGALVPRGRKAPATCAVVTTLRPTPTPVQGSGLSTARILPFVLGL